MQVQKIAKRFLTRAEVARELGLSRHAVDMAIQRGDLPAARLGGRVLVSRATLDVWLARAEPTEVKP
jgi:excisionase family DNA binding protein